MSYTSHSVYEFISKQTSDPIVERKTCAVSGQKFAIFQSDLDFYNKISPTFAGQPRSTAGQIPTPTLCPEERQRRRALFRNERKLYRRKCDATGDNIISIYSPDKPYKVYEPTFRRSDKWDATTYGRSFDFSKTFNENFKELMLLVPRRGMINTNTIENSPYTNFTDSSKNIYMCSDVYQCDNVCYSHTIKNLSHCCDNLDLRRSEGCYDCLASSNLFNCTKTNFSEHCHSSHYISYSSNLNNCLFCVGLHNKSYCILNKQYTKEEYENTLKDYNKSDYINKYNNLLKNPKQCLRVLNSEDCIGNNIENSKKLAFCHEIDGVSNSKYIFVGYGMDNCMDTSIHNIECYLDYEAISGGKLKNSAFNILGRGGDHIFYTSECVDSSNLFGCIGLRNKSYCILNKQYSKEEYELTVAKIIAHMEKTGEWGELFHPSLSPFGYNETIANEYFPMSRQEAIVRGYKRQDNNYDPIIPEGAKVIDRKITTEEPKEDEQILKAIFVCEISGRPYRIIKQELEFYKKHNLPLPRKHSDIRHEERMKLRPGRTLYLRNCDKCNKKMLSVYATREDLLEDNKNYLGNIYCEECYQKEIYS